MLGVTVKRTKKEKEKEQEQVDKVTALEITVALKERRLEERDAAMLKLRADIATRVRVGHRALDVINLTSQLRGEVESSLLVEYAGDKIVVTATRHLTEAEYNKVVDILGFQLNRT